jgi:5-methylcytosine-specific restriction protein B
LYKHKTEEDLTKEELISSDDFDLDQMINFLKQSRESIINDFVTEDDKSDSLKSNNNRDIYMHPLNQILYGPPGTGKTFSTAKLAVQICSGAVEDKDIKNEYERLKKANRIAFVTFHQSFSYEDFVEGIRPVISENGEGSVMPYEIKKGIFKEICELAGANQIANAGVDIKSLKSQRIFKMSLGNTRSTEAEEIFDHEPSAPHKHMYMSVSMVND